MKRIIFSLFLIFSIGSSYAAELNVYASGLKFDSISPTNHKARISYILNAPAKAIEFQLLDESSTIVHTIALNDTGHLTKGEHKNVEIDLFGIPSGNYTWAIKATANANTELALVNDTTENRFNFFSPQGLSVDNHTNSPYFGRIYVAESRNATTEAGRAVKEGIYIFDALLTDVTNQGNESYAGEVEWNENNVDVNGINSGMYGPARMSIDEDGYVYICDNGKQSEETNTSGVWRMDPENPTNNFDCMLDESKRDKNGGYTRVNSIAVTGSGSERSMYILDDSDSIVKYEIGDNTNVSNRVGLINTQEDGIITALNTLVRGKEGDFWVFQYRANIDEYPAITHYNASGQRDFYVDNNNNNNLTTASYPNRRGNGAVSPDGKYLAFNCNNGLFIYTVTYDAYGVPSLSNRQTITTHGTSKNVDAIAFDVANNLYFTSASTEYFYAFALPKLENNHTTPAPASESITIAEVVPHIMAYDLDVEQDGENYIFSFYSNSDATSGKLLFYDNTDTKIAEITINQSISKGSNNTFSIHKSEMPKGENMAWKLQLTGANNEAFGIVYQESTPLTRAHAVIDNSPESDFFGRIYISNRGNSNDDANKGYHIYDYDYSKVITNDLCGRTGFSVSGRPTVDAEGYVYWTDYGDTYGGIYVMDPQTQSTTPFFDGSKESSGLWKNGSTEIGSSCSGASIYGSGASTKLFAMNEDGSTLPHNGCVIYDIGKSDGSTAHTWNKAPSKTIAITNNANGDFAIVGCTHGVWLSQSRAKGQNNEQAYSLMFYGNNGTQYYVSKTDPINGSRGAGLAVSADESKLAMVNGDGDILLFDIEWVKDDKIYRPEITLYTTYRTPYNAISSMHFDHAGNLITMAGNVYEGEYHSTYDMRLVVFSTPTNDNTTIIPARKRLAITTKVTLQDTKNNSEILEACSGKIKDATITRSLNAGMYNTLCLPFAVADLTGTCFEGAEILEYTSATIETFGNSRDICLNFEEVTSIEAGKPYLIEPESDITTMEFSDVTISATTASAITYDGITFQGILHPKSLTANDKSILFLIANNELAWANVDANMNGMRAYFKINDPSLLSARTRAIIKNGANTATNIEPITHEVVGNSAQKVIYNNNLYIIRDNKVYTSQGVEVRFIK